MNGEHNEVDRSLHLEMGQRPRRQRRHLPTSITSAVNVQKKENKASSSDSSKHFHHLPLLDMSTLHRRHHPEILTEENSEDEFEERDENTQSDEDKVHSISTSTAYYHKQNNSIQYNVADIGGSSTLRSRTRKLARGLMSDRSAKERARQYVLKSSALSRSTRGNWRHPIFVCTSKKYVYSLIIVLWILYIVYRLFMSIQCYDYSYLNVAFFVQNRSNKDTLFS